MIQRALLRKLRPSNSQITAPISRRSQPHVFLGGGFARRTPAAARWYASEPEAKKDDAAAAADEGTMKNEESAEGRTKLEMEKKDKEIIDLKDKYLRSVADFRNLQTRTERDMKAAREFAIQKFAKDLVESIDNLERALDTVPAEKLADKSEASKDLVNLYDGLKMTERILMQTLEKHGLVRFDPGAAGEKFNPQEHEALFMSPMEGKEDGIVFHVQSKGFKLNNRILRPAKVGVVKNS